MNKWRNLDDDGIPYERIFDIESAITYVSKKIGDIYANSDASEIKSVAVVNLNSNRVIELKTFTSDKIKGTSVKYQFTDSSFGYIFDSWNGRLRVFQGGKWVNEIFQIARNLEQPEHD